MVSDRESGPRAERVRSRITDLVFGCMADGDWMTVQQIAEDVCGEPHNELILKKVNNFIRNYLPSAKRPFRLERIKSGRGVPRYRFVKIKGPIASRKQVKEYAYKLIPLLDQLIRETNKDRVSISFGAVCSLATQIKQILVNAEAEVSPTNQASSVDPKA